MITSIRSLRRGAIAAAMAAMFGAAVGQQAAADGAGYSTWFLIDPDIAEQWELREVQGDPRQVHVTRVDGEGPVRHIFVLYPKASSAYDTAMSKILTVLHERNINAQLTVYNFQSDADRGELAIQLADEGDYELIFSMGSQSTAFLWENYNGGDLPVVSVCSKDPVMLGQVGRYDQGTGTNFAFTSLNMPVEVQLAYLTDFMPDLKNIAILVDSTNVSAVETQAQPMAALARERALNVMMVSLQDPSEAQRELQDLVATAVANMRRADPLLERSVFWITGSTSVFNEIATINAFADRVPVLSVVPENVMGGHNSALMSIGISFESNAHLAAVYGVNVLEGTAVVGDLPVGIVSPPDIAINFLRAREIGLEIPFNFIEIASSIYGYDGQAVRQSDF